VDDVAGTIRYILAVPLFDDIPFLPRTCSFDIVPVISAVLRYSFAIRLRDDDR